MMVAIMQVKRNFLRPIQGLGVRWQTARARRAAGREVAAMSDRELADMGTSRSDLHRLFDPNAEYEFESRRKKGVGRAPGRCEGSDQSRRNDMALRVPVVQR